MKQYVLTFLSIAISTILLAQNPAPVQVLPCGTPPVKSDWLKRYQANPTAFDQYSRNQNTLYAAMTLQIVGSDNGTGYVSYMDLMEGFCGLNADMAQVDIQFFIHDDILFIDSTGWYSHSTVLEGADMMFANNIDSTLNCYVVTNPAGNAGYNLPYAGIALTKNGASGGHVWSHEVGHNLSVQHPFLGWEGNTYSYSNSTPTTVTYNYTNFKDSLITDTVIIDTAFVELVDGSNCTFAADGFCDTPPDYLAIGGWQCNAQGLSTILQKDPNDVDFRSDATNIMTYANDACGAAFTGEQIAAMRASLQTKRSPYLFNQNPMRDTITATANMLNPIAGQIEQFDYVELEWETVPSATHYIVQVSRFVSFAIIEYNALTTDTSLIVTNLLNQKDYYWRIKAFNQGYTCAPISPSESFSTDDILRTENLQLIEAFSIYPTLLENGQQLNIEISSRERMDAEVVLFNISGQQLMNNPLPLNVGENKSTIDLPNLIGGTYIVQVRTNEGVINEKIVVY
ncbi:MAG: hypothetical protein ACJA1N_000869 [Saprospiraceae bacterium]|jgi:hypothetical protein